MVQTTPAAPPGTRAPWMARRQDSIAPPSTARVLVLAEPHLSPVNRQDRGFSCPLVQARLSGLRQHLEVDLLLGRSLGVRTGSVPVEPLPQNDHCADSPDAPIGTGSRKLEAAATRAASKSSQGREAGLRARYSAHAASALARLSLRRGASHSAHRGGRQDERSARAHRCRRRR